MRFSHRNFGTSSARSALIPTSNKLMLDYSKRKYMKSLATQKPPEVYEEVNKFIRVSYSKALVFSQVVIFLVTINVEEVKVAN